MKSTEKVLVNTKRAQNVRRWSRTAGKELQQWTIAGSTDMTGRPNKYLEKKDLNYKVRI
jgi:hypothetical protein